MAGLTMTRLARALSIQPPSLYTWFPSVLAVHDAVFARGQWANLTAWRDGVAGAEPGLVALSAGMTAAGGKRFAASGCPPERSEVGALAAV